MASIPLFGLYRRTPAPFGKGRELLFPVSDGILVNLGILQLLTLDAVVISIRSSQDMENW